MSLKKNFIYSSILTVSTYLFPLIVYPYVSRVLGLSNIGIVNFVDNLINYFMLISMMGITTVGVREIAAVRSHGQQLSRTFTSLLTLTLLTTLFAIAVLWIAMYTVPMLALYRDMLYVGLIKLAFNLFLIEWFFMGMEDFRYITNRSILVKCLYVASVFLFVKESSDYKIFYALSVAMVACNAIVNIVYSRRFVRFSFRKLDMRPYAQSFFIMGVYVLLTNVYTSLNAVWLGFVTDTDEVGYYTTATKLHTIIMAVLLSFTNILFPRVSNLLAEGKKEEFWSKINIAFDAIFLFAFPTISFVVVAGPELLHLIVGSGFEGSYVPLRIITPLVLIIGIEQILVIQILMAMHRDNTVLRNSFLGALVAVVFNLLLTARLGAVGSAIVWIVAECSIMGFSSMSVWQKFQYVLPWRRVMAYCLTYAPLVILSAILYHHIPHHYVLIGGLACLTILYAAVVETFVLKNHVLRQVLTSFPFNRH